MTGVVLLDDEQQRVLYQRVASRHGASSSTSSGHRQATSAQPRSDSNTTVSYGSSGKPSIAVQGSPRTDFTSRSRPVDTTPQINGDSVVSNNAMPWMYDDPTRSSHSSSSAGSAATNAKHAMSLKLTVLGVALGFALGLALHFLEVSDVVGQWVFLPGDLFLRALKCLVVPYVFCAVAVAIGDIVFVGKVSIVGMQTARMFATFWISTTIMGISLIQAFRPVFHTNDTSVTSDPHPFGVVCASGYAWSTLQNGSVACMERTNVSLSAPATFRIEDINGIFVSAATTTSVKELSLGEMLRVTVKTVISGNLFQSFIDSELLAIITFAMVLGSIAGRSYFTKTRSTNYLYLTLLQTRNALFMMMEWAIALTPVALISVIAGFFGTHRNSIELFAKAHWYVLAVLAAAVIQVCVLLPLVVFITTRTNPYNHMKQMLRAYIFAFACSSSIATAPVSVACIKKARVCSQSLSNFVVSIGVCSNMSSAGFLIPAAVVYIAESSGNGDKLTVLRFVGLFVLSLLACASVPPIPSSSLVIISSIYLSLFGVSDMPHTFTHVVAMDFLVDRIATVCNVNDDLMALKIIAENTDETVVQDHLGERF